MNHRPPALAHGFVRVPRPWLHLEITPGAKVLLVQLCAAANSEGSSWYSLEQLGNIVGRSKASVSAYLDELRQAGVVSTLRQKTANGFNYRLLITLSGWKASSDARGTANHSAGAKTERGVRRAERTDPTGPEKENHTNKPGSDFPNQKTADSDPWSERDEADWIATAGPNPSIHERLALPEPLLRAAIARKRALARHLGILEDAKARTCEARERLEAFVARRSLSASPSEISASAAVLADQCAGSEILGYAIKHLDQIWEPHWRRAPSPHNLRQIRDAMLRAFPELAERMSRYATAQTRAWLAKRELNRREEAPAERRPAARSSGSRPSKSLPPDLAEIVAAMSRRAGGSPATSRLMASGACQISS